MSPTTSAPPFDLSLGLEDTHVLITGGNGYLGRAVAAAFLAANARVTIVDLPSVPKVFPSSPSDPATQRLNFHPADISSPAAVDAAFTGAEARFGPVACCVALAGLDLSVLPQTASLADAEPDDWRRVWDVNVHGTFVTCRRWLRGVRATVERGEELRNVSVVIVGSVSGRFGEEGMAAYAAGKAAVQHGLLTSLALDAPRIHPRARVNAVAPGAIDTERFRAEIEEHGSGFRWRECEATTPLAQPVPADQVARAILFLASENSSGMVHGQLIPVDGGLNGRVAWTREELERRRGGETGAWKS